MMMPSSQHLWSVLRLQGEAAMYNVHLTLKYCGIFFSVPSVVKANSLTVESCVTLYKFWGSLRWFNSLHSGILSCTFPHVTVMVEFL